MLNSATGTMSNSHSYGNERSGTGASSLEPEYGIDPASGGFFHADSKKHDDLKEMLDSNKDSLKLEAMKRIIGMVAKGRDASMLFPAVVKNVVSKNIEVKKLVYVYLERYAEEQQDLALLSISTFQRALKEPNQLIRAGALRVLSSIRVGMIAPIVMIAIRDAAQDMSPYVRKTAAHAIPKLYSLDNETKPELIVIIQKLLADKTVLVIGSAVMAFTKVCPERVNLIHQVYRKLCTLLVDVDEWGQVIILNTLTRYCRTQFANPNLHDKGESDRNFYDSSSDSSDKQSTPSLDPDHRLLLRSARPLLQSRNAAVVVAVAQLYHHCAPKSEGLLAAKALVRLLRSHTEVQCIVLDVIASMSYQRKGMFEYYLKNFFIRTSDPTRIKLLKLDILTNIACDANVSLILREMQTYILSNDKQFAAATIQAIGRCACQIADIADSCLNGLVSLLSNGNEAIVAESVIVIKRLLQTKAADPKEIVRHMTKLLDTITVPNARAAILWLLGEHAAIVPLIAPDILRKMAKTFPDEQGIVKLQVLNLAVKLYIRNEEQTMLLCKYIFTLARYDQDYDIRDRARLLKPFTEETKIYNLSSRIEEIFLAPKPAPLLQSHFKDREDLQLGSLSHFINMRAIGYEPLPPFPEIPPPGDVRDVEPIADEMKPKSGKESFSWVSGSSVASSCESDFSGSSSSVISELESAYRKENKYSGQLTSEASESESSEEETSDDDEDEDEEEESESEEDDDGGEEEEDEAVRGQGNASTPKPSVKNHDHQNNTQSNYYSKNLDLLLDLNIGDDIMSATPVMMPSNSLFTPINNNSQVEYVVPQFIPTKTTCLLDRIRGKGLSVTYKFNRTPHIFNRTMVNISLTFHNTGKDDIRNIAISQEDLDVETIQSFGHISSLTPGFSVSASMGIDFKDKISTVYFDLISSIGTYKVSVVPTVGELMRPITMPLATFVAEQEKLRGMHDESVTIKCSSSSNVTQKIYEVANVGLVDKNKEEIRFAGETLKTSTLVLVTITFETEEKTMLRVNCDKYPFGTILLNELKSALQ